MKKTLILLVILFSSIAQSQFQALTFDSREGGGGDTDALEFSLLAKLYCTTLKDSLNCSQLAQELEDSLNKNQPKIRFTNLDSMVMENDTFKEAIFNRESNSILVNRKLWSQKTRKAKLALVAIELNGLLGNIDRYSYTTEFANDFNLESIINYREHEISTQKYLDRVIENLKKIYVGVECRKEKLSTVLFDLYVPFVHIDEDFLSVNFFNLSELTQYYVTHSLSKKILDNKYKTVCHSTGEYIYKAVYRAQEMTIDEFNPLYKRLSRKAKKKCGNSILEILSCN